MKSEIDNIRKSPPFSGLFLYWGSILLIPFLLQLETLWFLLAFPLMIIVHYGTHEAVHGSLTPGKKHSLFSLITGFAGFALFGHNFIFLRWSHLAHHRYGRTEREYTIDGRSENSGKLGLVEYYLMLFGASCIYHELAGYLYPLLGDKYHILSRRFKRKFYRNWAYLLIQTGVFLVTLFLLIIGGWKFVFCRFLFVLYWGAFQNVAHYGLEIGKYENAALAARTYRLPKILEFLMFRSGVYHLEHHAFPNIPGIQLNNPAINDKLKAKLNFSPEPIIGLHRYLLDVLRQYQGPKPTFSHPKDWKPKHLNES